MTKIGDALWQFDRNRREFGRRVIVGETPKSWLCARHTDDRSPSKVNKATLREAGKPGFGGYQWFTTAGMEADIWKQDNRRKIVDLVERADGETLRRVAEVVGYKEKS